MKILTINPGSTSTKVAVFEDKEAIYIANVAHNADELAKYENISDQLGYRKMTILKLFEENNVDLTGLDAVVGRGGGLMAVEGGTYEINDTLLDHARCGANGVQHPANLGSQIAHEFAVKYNCPGFVVNPPDTDELIPEARITGIKGVYRNVHLHALNLKETAIQHAASIGKRYEDCSFVVCHIGGGISISAHRNGRMIDGNDIVGGEGPMAPTRCGSVPVVEVLKMLNSVEDIKAARALCTKTGGFVSHLGTSDALEVSKKAANDNYAKLIWDAMIYQIIKEIGAMAAVLGGKVDGILLGGGMVHNEELVSRIKESCCFIAPITAYPGEFEMEAMAAGAIRILKNEEQVKTYTGKKIWS